MRGLCRPASAWASCRRHSRSYTELTVRQNLELHARLFHLPTDRIPARVQEMVERFGLRDVVDALPDSLPLGIRQRLSLAVAVIHGPELLILDEPTSGVDPVARDSFWALLIDLSRQQGVTIFISTHFMNEGAHCDRISLMHAGKVLAQDAPAALLRACGVEPLEEAFIAYLEEATATEQGTGAQRERCGLGVGSCTAARTHLPSPGGVSACVDCGPMPSARPSKYGVTRSGSRSRCSGRLLLMIAGLWHLPCASRSTWSTSPYAVLDRGSVAHEPYVSGAVCRLALLPRAATHGALRRDGA